MGENKCYTYTQENDKHWLFLPKDNRFIQKQFLKDYSFGQIKDQIFV